MTEPQDKQAAGGALSHVVDAAVDLVSDASIPAPLRRNAFKALGQLYTAAIDVPIAHLEAIAAEKRAESEARQRLILASGAQIASQMEVDPAYVAAAATKFAHRVVREQVNLDMIAQSATRHLRDDSAAADAAGKPQPEPPPINEDWLNAFEKEASQKSTDEMRETFARILANEIRAPSSYSIRTVRLLGQMDAEVAQLFKRLCALCVTYERPGLVHDARALSFEGSAASNALAPYGITFAALNALNEAGLVIADYKSYMDYSSAIPRSVEGKDLPQIVAPLVYQGRTHALLPQEGKSPPSSVRVHGVALSRSGRELLSVVDPEEVSEYTAALRARFANNGLDFVPVSVQYQQG